MLKNGDILFARSGATVGKAYLYTNESSEDKICAFAGYLIKAECNPAIALYNYVYYYVISPLFFKWKESIFNKATIENIGADKYNELYIILPPLPEQEAIVTYLDAKTAEIDQAISLKTQQITQLKSYKSSLINEVVTGKVRVS